MAVPTLTRVLKPGMKGGDVKALRRVQLRLLGRAMPTTTDEFQRTFNNSMTALTKAAQDDLGVSTSGWIGPETMKELREADRACGGCLFKAYELKLLEDYADEQKPKLVEPSQGFDALDSSLWKAFSLGRSRPYSFSDLGVYNPSAANKAIDSDHAVYPAFAFDLGIDPDTGWNHLKARAYVLQVVGWREVEYVILGDRIYHGRSWRRWSRGGHLNHIHVSGVR